MRRVVITGIGVVSPVGCTLDDFWSALAAGRSGIGAFTIARSERLATQIAAQVSRFDAARLFEPKQLNLMDRVSQFAVAAARGAAFAIFARTGAAGRIAAFTVRHRSSARSTRPSIAMADSRTTSEISETMRNLARSSIRFSRNERLFDFARNVRLLSTSATS